MSNKTSIVTVKIVRKNDQYAYKLKGKGEQYLVTHEDGAKPEDSVIEHLSDYAQVPIQVESIITCKNNPEILPFDPAEGDTIIYKAIVQLVSFSEETGKETKQTVPVYIHSESIDKALSQLIEHSSSWISDVNIKSISKTNLIEVING